MKSIKLTEIELFEMVIYLGKTIHHENVFLLL